MPFYLLPGDPAYQDQLEVSCVVDVRREVHQAFGEPPERHRRAEGVTVVEEERSHTDQRHEKLSQTAAEHRHEPAERHEDEMPRFMKRQVDEVHEVPTHVV